MVFKQLLKPSAADLANEVVELRRQLREAEEALEKVKTGNGTTRGDDNVSDGTFGVNAESSSIGSHPPVSHRGYLFKWQDRSIGWGGTKWALRFVSLQKGKISYFRSHNDSEPRYVLSLRGFAVRDDGLKINNKHTSKGGKHVSPPTNEVGAYFHVFSIYQRQTQDGRRFYVSASDYSIAEEDSKTEIVPLLRFSTPSLAEKTQWIMLLSEHCAYCDTEAYLEDEKAAMSEAERRKEQQISMAKAMPQAARGTLPPLYFAPASPPKSNCLRQYGCRNGRRAIHERIPRVQADAPVHGSFVSQL
jgi:hypothetical protein